MTEEETAFPNPRAAAGVVIELSKVLCPWLEVWYEALIHTIIVWMYRVYA